MRRQPIIFLAAILGATALAGCASNKKEVEAARRSLYDTDFSVVYGAALEATRESYPNLEDAPGRGSIRTQWQQVTTTGDSNDVTNGKIVASSAGAPASASGAAGNMPTRLAYKRSFIRFDVSVAGGRPWRLKVVGHAAEWEPGAAQPTELHGVARPGWLETRTDALIAAIYKRVKQYAVPMKDPSDEVSIDDVKKTDPTSFKDVPPEAAKRLAVLKDALAGRDYAVLRTQLADDVVWSLGGGVGADVAIAMWQADAEPLEHMAKAIASGCGGDAQKVSCPVGAPVAGQYQLQIAPRADGWRVTSFVKAE